MMKGQFLREKLFWACLTLLFCAAPVQAQQANPPPPQAATPNTLVAPVQHNEKVPNPQTLPGPPPVRNTLDIRQVKEIGGPFSLVDQEGKKVTEKDYEKYYKLIYFGYTNCPGTCSMGLTKLSKALTILGPYADKVRVLFITTDPTRDTPEVMKKYIANFKSDKIVGLTGTVDDIRAIENKFRIFAEVVNDPRRSSYTINHSTIIYFMGFGKDLLEVMNTADSPPMMAGLMRQHLRSTKPSR